MPKVIKLFAISAICLVLVSQSALAWSFWGWLFQTKTPAASDPPLAQTQQPTQPINVDCSKQASEAQYYQKLSDDFQRQIKAWQNNYEMAMDYAKGLEKEAAENDKLRNLCNTYIYPQCPASAVKLNLACTESMLPELFCSYDIQAFNPNTYPYYTPKVCDIISFDVTPFQTTDVNDRLIEISRLTHRIVAINGSRYVTKGDAAPRADAYSPQLADIRYVVCR